MSSFPSKIKTSFSALVLLALANAAASAQEPTPAALNYASQIFLDIGVKASLDQVIAGMASELEHNVTATRPELRDALRETLIAIAPEFLKTEQSVLDGGEKFLASRMTEQELKETAAFYESATGKKFVEAQGATMGELASLVRPWREQLSTDILARAREEMKKKGYTF